MRIVLINNIYFPEGSGGGEMVVKNRARVYAKDGHSVTIIVPGESYSEETFESNITLVRFKPIHLFLYKNAGLHSLSVRLIWHIADMFNIATYFQIKRILKKIHPDRVEVHNLKGVGFLIPSAIRALNLPFSMYLHDIQLAIPSGILLYGEEKTFINNGFLQKLYEWTIKSLVGSPDEVISPSEWLRGFYKKRNFFRFSKMTVLTLERKKEDIAVIEKKLRNVQNKIRNNEKVVCIFIGKLETYKGIGVLIGAWKRLPENITLKVYGIGTLEKELLSAKKDGSMIELFGYRKHSELVPALKSADVLVMPTLCYENRPETILEALASGVPVVASDIGGIGELVQNGSTGYLFNPGDVRGLLTFFTRQK